MFKVVVFITILVIPYLQRTVSDCTDSFYVPDPVFVGCYQIQGQADPFLPYEIQTAVFDATGCVSCCAAENQSFNFAGIYAVTHPNNKFRCTCGQRNKSYYDSITDHGTAGCLICPGNSDQSCGHYARVSVYKVPQFNLTTTTHSTQGQRSTLNTNVETTHLTTRPSVISSSQPPGVTSVLNTGPSTRYTSGSFMQTSHSTQLLTSESSISSKTNSMGASRDNTALIAGSAGGGAAVLLIVSGVVAVIIIYKRSSTSKKNNLPSASISLDDIGGGTGGLSNPSTSQPNDANLNALYAKPDKKRRNQQHPPNTADPDDPSYQDVLPSGAQHQYATVRDDPHPYTAVRDEPNVYEAIQDDPQYAIVQKGRKHVPNAETNPLYARGSVDNTAFDPESPLSNDDDMAPSVCEMVDNIIYE